MSISNVFDGICSYIMIYCKNLTYCFAVFIAFHVTETIDHCQTTAEEHKQNSLWRLILNHAIIKVFQSQLINETCK